MGWLCGVFWLITFDFVGTEEKSVSVRYSGSRWKLCPLNSRYSKLMPKS